MSFFFSSLWVYFYINKIKINDIKVERRFLQEFYSFWTNLIKFCIGNG